MIMMMMMIIMKMMTMTVRINMRMTLMKWWTLNRPPCASMYNRSPGGGRNNPFGRKENWYIIARRAGKLPNSWRWTPLKEIWQKNFRFLLQVGAGGWVGSAWERDQADNRSHFHFNSPPKCPNKYGHLEKEVKISTHGLGWESHQRLVANKGT